MSNHFQPSSLEELSQSFLAAARQGIVPDSLLQRYSNLTLLELVNTLKGDEDKLAFWINTYNAFTLFLLGKNDGNYGDRSRFFKEKNFTIAAIPFSLDDIEHGILRSKNKYALGYLGKLLIPVWEKKLRVQHLDFRIHFALNCGAVSCPPIKFYDRGKIEEQLELATTSNLQSECVYNKGTNRVEIPALFKWYAADFNKNKSVLDILKTYKILPLESFPDIVYNNYNWDISTDPFQSW